MGGQVPYVKLNGLLVWNYTAGQFRAISGVNVIIVDPANCTKKEWRHFGTGHSRSEAEELRDYLQRLRHGTILVGVTYDEPTAHLNASKATLSQLGVDVYGVASRAAFAFATRKGDRARTVFKKQMNEKDAKRHPPRIFATFSGALYTIYHRSSLSLHCVP